VFDCLSRAECLAARDWIGVVDAIERPMKTRRPYSRFHAGARLAFAAVALGVASTLPALTQDAPGKPMLSITAPLPPVRPPEFDRDRIPVATPAPPAVATGPASAPVQAPAPSAAALAPLHPLPPASRERMHACGLEWKKMKMSGAARDKTWRDFAQICLAE
jgi:hypothetical protein